MSTWVVPKSPDSITGLVGWWDFGDTTTLYNATSGGSVVTADGGSVSRVNDKSGNGKHLIAGNAPVYKTGIANSRGILRFNGSSNYIANNSFPYANTALSAFVVCRTTATAGSFQPVVTVFPATNASAPNDDYMYLSLQDSSTSPANDRYGYGGTNAASTSAVTRSAFAVYGISASSGTSALAVNGASVATGASVDTAKSNSGVVTDIPTRSVFNVGAVVRPANSSGVNFWTGDMCEIAWYSSDISSGDKASLVAWLKSKWGIA
jgi:predicted 3-demethylubiquinone-9 3-methyltransferase (glyoxalase superfamily)